MVIPALMLMEEGSTDRHGANGSRSASQAFGSGQGSILSLRTSQQRGFGQNDGCGRRGGIGFRPPVRLTASRSGSEREALIGDLTGSIVSIKGSLPARCRDRGFESGLLQP